jgi:hypothetical protein
MFAKSYFIFVMTSVILIAGCGGGGSSSTTTPVKTQTTINLSGTAATGDAISGGTVEAVCAAGTVAPTTTDSVGSYTLDLTGATYPCLIRVSVPGTTNYLYSLAESGSTKANLTPLTHFLTDLLFGANASTVFANFNSIYAQKVTTANITSAKEKVVAALTALGIDVSAYDFMKASFTPATPNGQGDELDKKLDQLSSTLIAADKSLTELSTAINDAANSPQTIASITATAIGPSVKSLSGCPYVRGGGYFTFSHDGGSFQKWIVDLDSSVMTATLYGTANTFPIASLVESGEVVPCAFTITKSDSVITAYFSKSGIFAWKQRMNLTGGYFFGMGVPVQTKSDLKNSNFLGTYPMLGYVSTQYLGQKYQAALPMEISIDASGNVKSASCTLTNGAPVCEALADVSSDADKFDCGSNSLGVITCASKDGAISAKVFAFVSQQEPTVFMLMSGTVSGATYSALVVGTKSRILKLPSVGVTQTTSTGWYFSRSVQANPYTSWNFTSGESSVGASTTVASVSNANGSFTTGNGLVWFLNLPLNGQYWVPTVVNTTYPLGSTPMLTLTSGGGWQMRVKGRPSATSFDDFTGIEFYISKPRI